MELSPTHPAEGEYSVVCVNIIMNTVTITDGCLQKDSPQRLKWLYELNEKCTAQCPGQRGKKKH